LQSHSICSTNGDGHLWDGSAYVVGSRQRKAPVGRNIKDKSEVFKKNALQGILGQTYSVKPITRPSAARNEVNFCAEMLGTPPLLLDVLVLEAPAAVLDVWEPPLGAVLVGATPLAEARKAS